MIQRLAEEMLEGSLDIASYRLSCSRNELGCAAVSRYVRHRARLGCPDCQVGLHHGVAHLLGQRGEIARRVRNENRIRPRRGADLLEHVEVDRKSTRLNSSHL